MTEDEGYEILGCMVEFGGGALAVAGCIALFCGMVRWACADESAADKAKADSVIEQRVDSVKTDIMKESAKAIKHPGRTNLYHISQNTR